MKKKYRIKKNSEIQKLIKTNNTVGDKKFIVYYNNNDYNENFRFAIGVSKKIGNAVMRNYIKRVIREIIKDLDIDDNVDFFIIPKAEVVEAKYVEVKDSIIKLLTKAKILRK